MWDFEIRHWVTINQNTRDPDSPDHFVNCGLAATSAMLRWQTGRHFDPERLREMAGDAVNQGTGTGTEVDQWAWGPSGPGAGHIAIDFPRSERALAWHLFIALKHHHPIKVLQWYDERQTEGHWRVVHAGRLTNERGGPEYLSGDPWTGLSIDQGIGELWNLFLGVIVVPLHPRLHRA